MDVHASLFFVVILELHDTFWVHQIFLTHGHADAILGLDDVRDLQQIREVRDSSGKQLGYRAVSGPLKVISNKATISTVKRAFPYLAKKQECVPGLKDVVLRRVAQLDFITVSDDAEISSDCGLRVKLFPVYHGGTYISLGFEFGRSGEFVYISGSK
mmetsp:Transcript_25594/g.41045  ORF Transcript_25594/g.41045 Transcript_25594/m.41045 type:complete len:157 (-) Transcript_25594:134-604(-)